MLVKKHSLIFRQAQMPITGFVTKFGGQPTWWNEPQWPLSRATGEPMRFICQIALDATLFSDIPGRMAYLFITDGETFVDNTFDPEGGENALIIQPGKFKGATQLVATGPSLQAWVDDNKARRRVPVEFIVEFEADEDPDVLDENTAREQGDTAWEAFTSHWNDNKLGGTAAFLQGSEYPSGGPWKLLMQLNDTNLPFDLLFGDGGIGYAFISADGEQGRFLWQC